VALAVALLLAAATAAEPGRCCPPSDLGDGDHENDGRPVVPVGVVTGGFFWRGCGSDSWQLGNWFVTSDRQRDAFPRELDPSRDASTKAHALSGADLAAGAVLWVQLDHLPSRPVSVSGCSGVSFWARLESSSERLVVALNDGSRASGLPDGKFHLTLEGARVTRPQRLSP